MTPHVHADLIKAWADGAEIEWYWQGEWRVDDNPSWSKGQKFRIKDPYAVLKAAAEDPTKEIWTGGKWFGYGEMAFAFDCPPDTYKIRDKHDPYAELKAAAKDPNWREDEPTPPAPTEAKFTPYEAPITDPVTSPSHYQLLPGVEVIHVRKALLDKMQAAGWTHYQSDCWSRSWEYLTRAMAKNGLEDLKKARTYLDWLIESLEKME